MEVIQPFCGYVNLMCSQLLSLGHPCIETGPIIPHVEWPQDLCYYWSLNYGRLPFLTFEKWKVLILASFKTLLRDEAIINKHS